LFCGRGGWRDTIIAVDDFCPDVVVPGRTPADLLGETERAGCFHLRANDVLPSGGNPVNGDAMPVYGMGLAEGIGFRRETQRSSRRKFDPMRHTHKTPSADLTGRNINLTT